MTKATIRTAGDPPAPTPSAQVSHSGVEYDVDSRNRRIGVIKPSAIMRYRVLKMFGANTPNQGVMGYAMIACCCHSIDGDVFPPSNSEPQIQAMIERLGDEGLEAITRVLRDKFGIKDPEQADEVEGTVKNS